MPDAQISRKLRQRVIDRANGCCEYCLSQAKFSPDPFSVEHIVPRSKGGSDWEKNLAFSCQGCNGHKYTATEGSDPINGELTALYNPRLYRWGEHFVWDENFSVVVGRTAIGRATVSEAAKSFVKLALQMSGIPLP